MSDLIDRQAAIDASCTCHGGVHCNHYPCKDVQAIMDLPTIEAEPVRNGRWVRHYTRPNVFADLYWHCSACGYKNDNQYANRYHKYCPNCGAKMDEVTDDQ